MRSAAWLFVILTACSPPVIVFEETLPPPVYNERPVEQPVRNGIRPGECPARIAEYPTPYLADKLLIRLPVAMSADNFVEFTPGILVRSKGTIESSNCHEGMTGALIRFAALVASPEQPQPDRPLQSIRDDLLEALGYPDESVLIEQDHDATKSMNMWVFEIPADESRGKSEPGKILVAMWVTYDETLLLVFEVHPDAWPVMVDTFVASAKHVSVLSP